VKEEQEPQVKKKRLVKIISIILGAWLLLVASLVIALQFPAVQTYALGKLTDYLNQKTNYPISIGHVAINWIDEIELEQVKVKDSQDSLMIGIERAIVDFSINGLLNPNQPGLDAIELYSPEVYLTKNTPDSGLNINGFIYDIKQLLPIKKNNKTKKLPFVVNSLQLYNARFGFNDPYKDSINEGFDFNHFVITDLNAQANNFLIFADTIGLDVQTLSAYLPAHDFHLDTLQTNYLYSNEGMYFDDLLLKAGSSTLKDSLAFTYRDQATLSYFQDSVDIAIDFRNSYLAGEDLAVFVPALKQYQDNYNISGNFRGKIGRFQVNQLYARFGQRSLIAGNINIDGLPNTSEAFLDLNLEASRLYPDDLKPYINEVFVQNLRKLGETKFNGQFLGFPNDFVANGTFYTQLGYIRSDINLKLAENPVNSTYSGNLALSDFNIGQLIDEPLVGNINMSGSVEGKGISLNTAQMNLKAKASSFRVNNYSYKNIEANGQLAQRYFEGKLNVEDPNLRLSGNTTVDFRKSLSHIAVDARLDTALLEPLKLIKDTLNFSGNVSLDIYGLKLAELTGESFLTDFTVQYKNRDLNLDTLYLSSTLDSADRQISLHTNLLNFSASGNWEYEDVVNDFQRLFQEYKLNFENDKDELQSYYAQKELPEEYKRYQLRYELNLLNPNPVVQLFLPKLYISDHTKIAGSFSSGYTSIFTANTQIDTLVWDQQWLYNTQLDLLTSKIADSTSVLASAYVYSEDQQLEGVAKTKNLQAEAIWNEDHIEVTASAQQAAGDNYAQLVSDVYFLTDRTTISFNTLEAKLLENIWSVDGANLITIRDGLIEVDDLLFAHDQQKIMVEGQLSSAPGDTLLISLEDIELANLNPILGKELGGKANGQLYLQEILSKPVYRGNLRLDSLSLNGFYAGNFDFQGDWSRLEQKLYTTVGGWRKGKKILTASGHYNPYAPDNMLNLEANLNEVPLNLLEPFFGGIFSEIGGTTSGNILVLGTPTAPILRGKSSIANGKFNIEYLNTYYTFLGDIVFTENEIGFRNIELKDIDGNSARLGGGVFHDGFSNFIIDLSAQLANTQVLNTTLEDNSLFYGTAYATGSLEILGPANNLTISASATSNKGTKIYIPIDYENKVSGADFINFVNHSDTASNSLSRKKTSLSGIKLDFDLDITPDAYCEIIFDLKSGDIIRGRGNGKLELTVDTEGNFDMFGTYEIEQGAYNFTLFNVITKEFVIVPGSTIRWLGDPYGGQMNIQAQYEQFASLSPLFPEGSSGVPVPNRPYPVNLLMDLSGDLMTPRIAFDFEILEFPPEVSIVDVGSVLNRMQNDEQLMNRQVFNLLVLRQFAPIDYMRQDNQGGLGNQAVGFGSQTAVSSISELLANQFSALASQIDQNLEIDVNFTSSIQEDAVNTFQLRLSYTFMDGRLRVTRDGSLTSRQDNTSNNYLGDWTVEYRLTADGQFRVRLFRRLSSSQVVSTFTTENIYSHGFSLLQTKSFDSFKELITPQKPEPPPIKTPQPDSEPEDLILMVPEDPRSTRVQPALD
jgi:hypothetical protein